MGVVTAIAAASTAPMLACMSIANCFRKTLDPIIVSEVMETQRTP